MTFKRYKLTFLGMVMMMLFFVACKDSMEFEVQDRDGNTYPSTRIGNQIWMTQNLKTTVLNDGTPIPEVRDHEKWVTLTTPGLAYYDNNIGYAPTYGALYNWKTVETGKLCPSDWHIPSEEEWLELFDFLDTEEFAGIAGTVLKSTTGWGPDGNGTDNYGFSAYPGGRRNDGLFSYYDLGQIGFWWSSTSTDPSKAISLVLLDGALGVGLSEYDKRFGFSVRCLKD